MPATMLFIFLVTLSLRRQNKKNVPVKQGYSNVLNGASSLSLRLLGGPDYSLKKI